jgi:hypothetical protein
VVAVGCHRLGTVDSEREVHTYGRPRALLYFGRERPRLDPDAQGSTSRSQPAVPPYPSPRPHRRSKNRLRAYCRLPRGRVQVEY